MDSGRRVPSDAHECADLAHLGPRAVKAEGPLTRAHRVGRSGSVAKGSKMSEVPHTPASSAPGQLIVSPSR
jgi:hypothetical protein